jgi:hypothetical protein
LPPDARECKDLAQPATAFAGSTPAEVIGLILGLILLAAAF